MNDPRASVARFYDLDRAPLADVPFYVSRLPGASARVLELGCGTGRVTLPLAEHCAFIQGIEISAAMLDICRAKLRDAPALSRKVAVGLGDITTYNLGTTFDLIIAPYRVLQNLETDDEVAGLFRFIRTHLSAGGTCILNVFKPRYANAASLIDAWSQPVEALDWEDVTDARIVTCHVRSGKVSSQPLVIYPDLIYRVREGAEPSEEIVFPLKMRCYFPEEFTSLFAKHGFHVVAQWGGYAGEQYGAGPELVIQAKSA